MTYTYAFNIIVKDNLTNATNATGNSTEINVILNDPKIADKIIKDKFSISLKANIKSISRYGLMTVAFSMPIDIP